MSVTIHPTPMPAPHAYELKCWNFSGQKTPARQVATTEEAEQVSTAHAATCDDCRTMSGQLITPLYPAPALDITAGFSGRLLSALDLYDDKSRLMRSGVVTADDFAQRVATADPDVDDPDSVMAQLEAIASYAQTHDLQVAWA